MDRSSRARTTTRLAVLAGLAFLWAFFILCRLVYLQVACHEALEAQARKQHLKVVPVHALRGAIFDRSGRILAKSLPLESVCINPLRLPDSAVAADLLSSILNLDRHKLLQRIQAPGGCAACHRSRRRGFLWVKRKISPDECARLRSVDLDWIEFRTESQRYYPNGSLAAHVIGAVDYDEMGNLGLEQSLNGELRGQPGWVKALVDVKKRSIESQVSAQARAGTDVTLALDAEIQFVAERELKAAAEFYRAATGSVVVMRPNTGEILALASYPGLDPNFPPQPDEDPSKRFDQPVSVPFEPGSVFKIVTVSAALDTTTLRPDSPIQCGTGQMNLFGRVIHEAKTGYGTLSMADVLARSSNIGAIQIALKVGDRRLLDYVRRFGFGSRTGVPLPAESTGRVRDWRSKLWTKSSIGSVAMGHEISATTLQLAQACSVIANGGMLVKPRLILRRQKPGAKPQAERLEPPRQVLKPENAIAMRKMMEGVVVQPYGTGRRARLKGYTSGGKTGSAQIYDKASGRYTHFYNASFVGFTPLTNPAVVVAVALNGVRVFGGVAAAPVFRAVATETLRMLNVPKDLPENLPEPETETVEADDLAIAALGAPPEDLPPLELPVAAPVAAAAAAPPSAPAAAPLPVRTFGPTIPSFTGKTMRAVLEESLAYGVRVEVIGSGIAREQNPPAGSFLSPGQRVRVEFQ